LPQADLIIVLGADGQIVKQGSFNELRDNSGDFTHIGRGQILQTDEAENVEEVPDLPNQPAESIKGSSADDQRQTMDFAVYKYYFSALGWLRISAFLLFLITEAGLGGFRCKL
jgi:hypothetical protein